MKVLVIGSGGREFAICRKLKASALIDEVYCAPGNPGMEQIGVHPVGIQENSFEALAAFANQHAITWTMVGPEDALADGIVDYFTSNGLKIIGPDKQAAQLESSKDFALNFMQKFHIPTAQHQTCTSMEEVDAVLAQTSYPTVIKEDGLAGGKGVFIVESQKGALKVLATLKVSPQTPVIFEEYLDGPEYSIFVLLNQKSFQILPVAQDHKKIFDHDRGPNTGGMGAYSPVPQFGQAAFDRTVNEIVEPTINGIHTMDFNYTGIIYIGIMMTANGPKVIEYNVRLGDPETQVVLPRIKNDFGKLLTECVDQEVLDPIEVDPQAYVNVVLAAKGYPQNYVKGQLLPDFEIQGQGMIDYANVAVDDQERLVGNGGRILSVIGIGNSIKEAQANAYEILSNHPVSQTYYRHDIANRAVQK